jgi:hypothetical protein
MSNHEDAEILAEHVRKMGDYLDVRVLPDGSVAAVGNLLTTRALFLGCSAWGWERRFCFSDRTLALLRFQELQSENDIPEGFIASRPEMAEEIERKSRP